jgi:methionyl-tRNA formyltransferase
VSLVFAGTPAFAVPSLAALCEAGLRPRCVVTQPDRPRGRGRKVAAPPVKREALERGLTVEQPDRFSAPGFLERLSLLRADLLVVVAYGQILKPAALDLFPRGALNLHPSLLPAYRGAAPMSRAILEGETRTGLTTFFLNPEMDAGDIILQEETPIGEDETAGELSERLSREGASLLVRSVTLALEGRAPRVPQDPTRATSAPRLTKSDGTVDWNWDARRVHRRILGSNPWPGATTLRRGEPLRLWRSRLRNPAGGPGAGVVEDVGREGIAIGCGAGSLWVTEVQAPGRKPMPADEWARGARVERGERWGETESPAEAGA